VPSRNGRTACIPPGVLPTISFASSPTARTWRFPLFWEMATTEGKLSLVSKDGTVKQLVARRIYFKKIFAINVLLLSIQRFP
jgi:hypothetical protein